MSIKEKHQENYGKYVPPCGNWDCHISTGIHEDSPKCLGLTFGSGELDKYGYWEDPCWICARDWEKKNPNHGPCWPFSEEELKKHRRSKECENE